MRPRCRESLSSLPLVLAASTRPGRRQEWPDLGGPSSGGKLVAGVPPALSNGPAPGLELRDVLTWSGNLDTHKAFVPLFLPSRKNNQSGSNKQKIVGTEREGGQKTRTGQESRPPSHPQAVRRRGTCLELLV